MWHLIRADEHGKRTGDPAPFSLEHGNSDTRRNRRIQIRLTETEYQALLARSTLERTKHTDWIVRAVRANLTETPQFTQTLAESLNASTRQLRAIGRNLNQIAKRINQGSDPNQLSPTQLERLGSVISDHTKRVGSLVDASLTRWKIRLGNQ